MTDINLKSSTIEKGLDIAKDFIQSLIKPSVDEVGLYFADKVKLWRFENQLKSINKIKAIVEKQDIKVKQINPKVLFPYLEAVSLEEDETLQNLWANLITNYIDAERNLTVTVYPEILRQISSEDAELLRLMSANKNKRLHITSCDYSKTFLKANTAAECLPNLERLGLIEQELKYDMHETDYYKSVDKRKTKVVADGTEYYFLTSFGIDFLDACTLDAERRNKK